MLNNTKKYLDSCIYQDKKYYIQKGVSFIPFANDLVKDNLVQRMMLDTTWNLLSNYVVSIPTVIIGNVGIPIGFSFSLVENFDIYNDFFQIFSDVFGYPMPSYIKKIESDQGRALQEAVKNQGMEHICYLRHLLVSLGKGKFACQVGNLVSATCEKNYNSLKKTYEDSWKKISNEDLNVLNELLNKIDLKMKIRSLKRMKIDVKRYP